MMVDWNKGKILKQMIISGLILLVILVLLLGYSRVEDFSNLIGRIVTGYGDDGSDELSEFKNVGGDISVSEEGSDELEKRAENDSRDDISASSGEEFDYYLIEMLYNGDSFSIVDWSLEKGNYPSGPNNKEFKLKLYSLEGEELFSSSFANPGMIFSDGINKGVTGGGVMEVEDVNFYINLPNIAGSDRFKILNGEDEVVFEINISGLGG